MKTKYINAKELKPYMLTTKGTDLLDPDILPAADVREVKHARWKCVSIGIYACSLCGYEPWYVYKESINMVRYCPNCGASMKCQEVDKYEE